VLLVLGLLAAGWVVVQLRPVIVQLLLAVILAAGMSPLVNRLTAPPTTPGRRWRPPRAAVVLLLYATLVALVALLGAVAVPPLLAEVEDLLRRLPTDSSDLQRLLSDLPSRFPLLPAELTITLADQLRQAAGQLTALFGQALAVARFAVGVLSGTLNGVFTLILALYLTVDAERIVDYLIGFLPPARQAQGRRLADRIGERLGGWVRGQILLSAIIGLLTLLGLSIVGVRYALLLAIIAAVGETVPMIGPIVSAVPALLIAALQSPGQVLATLLLYILIQQLENNLIVPRVMSRAVELHPLAVMLALLAGAELMGVPGAILSVPVTAAISVVLDELRQARLSAEAGRAISQLT
jgi:predicted PurR-regulated permease PerM